MTGWSSGQNGTDILTVALDADTGRTRWVARYDGPRHEDDRGRAVAVDPDGKRVFVTGVQDWLGVGCPGHFPQCGDAVTVAYDAFTGRRLWATSFDGSVHGEDVGSALATSSDGRVLFVAGATKSEGLHYGRWKKVLPDFLVLAYDAVTGNRLWSDTYDGPVNGWDEAFALGVAPSRGRLYVTGTSDSRPIDDYDMLTIAYRTGQGGGSRRLWVARHDGGVCDSTGANDLAVSADGSRLFVAGEVAADDGECWLGDSAATAYGTVAYDAASGRKVWAKRYSSVPRTINYATSLALAERHGMVVVTGSSMSTPFTDLPHYDTDAATLAYDMRSGRLRWEARYRPQSSIGSKVAVAPNGKLVYVAGGSSPSSVCVGGIVRTCSVAQALTLAYDTETGRTSWSALYETEGDGEVPTTKGRGIAFGSGRVYNLTLRMGSPRSTFEEFVDYDYGVLAYRAR